MDMNHSANAKEWAEIAAALAEAHRVCPVIDAEASGKDDSRSALRNGSELWQIGGTPIPVTDLGPTSPFASTVANRHSIRHLGPPTLEQIGLIVARAGLTRRRGRDAAGALIAQRPAPSAGARQPLTLVVLAHELLDRAAGGWVLDPDAAVLRPTTYTSDVVQHALTQVGDALHLTELPPAVILAVGRPQATLSRYPGGISLLWREVGALLMLLHLAATDIGLGSCLVGTCAVLHPVTNEPSAPVDLGAVALGTPAHVT
jgi:hypothetical protein